VSRTKKPVRTGALDQYFTPSYSVKSLLPHIKVCNKSEVKILEPCAGRSDILKVLIEDGYSASNMVGIDLEPINFWDLPVKVYTGNFLEQEFKKTYDLIVTNPPYNQAVSFVSKAITLLKDENSQAWFLLRLNFLGSKKRKAFFDKHMCDGLVLHKRPHFIYKDGTVGGSDNCEYLWACFYKDERNEGIFKVI
jgi:hypothetical protein